MSMLTRRTFFRQAATGGAALAGARWSTRAGDSVVAAQAARQRPHIWYGLSTGSWGRVIPPGQPLPLLKILDETAAAGFNGVRLTGFPAILAQNGLSIEQYGDELERRGLKFSTVSFGGQYFDADQHEDIRKRARQALAVHQRYGARAMIFFPPGSASNIEQDEALRKSFVFLNELGKMAVEEYGVRMGLHNHTDTLIENQVQVDRFLAETDPRYVFCAWDSAHLLLGGCDVPATYRKSIERLVYTDFKDATLTPVATDYLSPNGERFAAASRSGRFFNSMLELGRGQIDFIELMRILADAKYQGWINHDLDTIRVSTAESWRVSMDYVKASLDPVYQ
jgi:sugar phosphate isomerase/epimerase